MHQLVSAAGLVKYAVQHDLDLGHELGPVTFGDMLFRVGKQLHVDLNVSCKHKISFVDFHGGIVSKNRKFVVKTAGKTKSIKPRRRLLCKTPPEVLPWLNTTYSGLEWSGDVLDIDTSKEIPFRASTSSSDSEDS